MSKLIVVSNRVNFPNPNGQSAGGLGVALQDALNEIGGIWLGWNGEQIENHEAQYFHHQQFSPIEYITCPLTQQQYQEYYCGFANKSLWPAMHDRDDLMEFHSQEYHTYQEVNQMFAHQLSLVAEENDMIWIHDYHFMSVAHYCRELGMTNRFGFFLHIPFASTDIWSQIPVAEQLIGHLSQYDVLGLQTENDQKQCTEVLHYYMGGHIVDDILVTSERQVKIQAYPIGVNPDLIQKTAEVAEHEIEQPVFEFDALENQKTIIAVDRIDYSKGLIERFNAFAEFLKLHPEYHQAVTDLQIACPCRMDIPAYEALFKAVQRKVQAINAQFAQDQWAPINCTHQTVAHAQLMNIYRKSDICWVNSLKDGMNLVAKEFVAAQDPDDPGVLILSKYAGSADQMSEALIVDPSSKQSMVSALRIALKMSRAERIERYKSLMKGLKSFDIHAWRNAFLKDLKHINSTLLEYPRYKAPQFYSHYRGLRN